MSGQKLTIIVTCTDRKSATPPSELRVRNLPPGSLASRARMWTESLAHARSMSPLIDLYQGETWSQVKRLVATAQNAGLRPDVLVASAGLGLRRLSDSAPAYAATFSPGHPDTVAASTVESRAWWQALPHTQITTGGRALWVLSASYSRAIGPDLLADTSPDDLLVFGGSREIPDNARIASDHSLREALGGTTTSLNLRSATQWLLLSESADPFAPEARALWNEWSQQSRRPVEYNRTPMSDKDVREHIKQLRERDPTISKTRALKMLRSCGLACEQRRFSDLFERTAVQ